MVITIDKYRKQTKIYMSLKLINIIKRDHINFWEWHKIDEY